VTSREITLVLLSALLHAMWNLSTKGSRNPVAFAMVLSAITVVGLVALLPFFELGEIPWPAWRVLMASAVFHALYFFCLSKGYQSGDLSLVYPIARSTPAFVPLVAVPLLGETLSVPGALGIAVVVSGVWLVHADGWRRPRLRDLATRYALLTLAATVGYSLLDKQGMDALTGATWSSPVPRAVVYFFVVETLMFFLFFPLALRAVGAESLRGIARSELRGAAGAALASFASYSLILEAFRTAPVSYVVAARQLSVIFAVALGMVLLRERPSRVRLLGALATVAGVALIAVG
jgi:drug/metabolite transporter (DMT)-like permease